MLKASRDAVPEGKPLDPTLLQDGFLRVCPSLVGKNIKIFNCVFITPDFHPFVYITLYFYSLKKYSSLILGTAQSRLIVKNTVVSKTGPMKYSKRI